MKHLTFATLLTVCACTPNATSFETEATAAATFAIAPPALPARAALPMLTPCPPGWQELAAAPADGPVTCAPWPRGMSPACAAHQAQFIGESACAALGPECPTGDFAEGLPTQGVRYVKPGAASGGTGSISSPFSTIAAALINATSGTTIALAKGQYDEAVRVPAGVSLWGACVAQTRIVAPTSHAIIGTVTPLGADTSLRNVSVSGPRPGVVVGVGGSSLDLQNVEVFDAVGTGLTAANGATLTGSHVVVRGTKRSSSGGAGDGVHVEGGGTATLTHLIVDDTEGSGLDVFGVGSTLTATDVAVLRGRSMPDGRLGDGLEVAQDGHVTLTRFALETNHDTGVYAAKRGVATLIDGVIRDTLPRSRDQGVGSAITALVGGHVEATRVTFAHNHSFTVFADGADALLTLTDAVVRDLEPEAATRSGGFGISITGAAQLTASRIAVIGALATGITVDQPGSSLSADDVTVLDTAGDPLSGQAGHGLTVTRGATGTLHRARFERNHSSGLAVASAGSTLLVEDVTVRDTLGERAGHESSGVGAQDDATLTVHRALLEGNQMLGVLIIAAVMNAEDLTVRDTRGLEGTGISGRGAQVQTGGVLTVRRGVFEDNHEAAAAAVGLGSAATLHDIVLRTTKPRACVPGCPNEGGDGLAALDGAHVEATHFSVVGNVACGVQVADSSTMDLSDGFVSANRIGACVQGAAFDTARLSANVKYVANDTAFSGDFVPLPTQLAAPISLPGH